MNVCIVGGGISGLSTASLLREEGIASQVFEQQDQPGGLINCTIEHGSLFHRVGGHVFNSKNQNLLDWFWKKFNKETEFSKATRKAAIWFEDSFVDYPIELHLSQLDKELASNAVDDLLAIANAGDRMLCAQSFGEFLLNNFGQTLFEIYFKPYNQKIWNADLNSIPLEWLHGKLPMMDPESIIKSNIINKRDDMVHSFFYYPKQGGSQFIVDRIAKGLAIIREKVTSIERAGKGFIINKIHPFSHIVYTGDIRKLPSLLGAGLLEEAPVATYFRQLDTLSSNGTTTMLCECNKNDYSWIYIPSKSTKIHRIIMTGNFSASNNRADLPPSRTTCTVEKSGFMSQTEMATEIRHLPFAMTPIAYNYCPLSYIIHGHSTINSLSTLTSRLESMGIFTCGRFAEWQYYNMDAAIESAMRTTSKLTSIAGTYSRVA